MSNIDFLNCPVRDESRSFFVFHQKTRQALFLSIKNIYFFGAATKEMSVSTDLAEKEPSSSCFYNVVLQVEFKDTMTSFTKFKESIAQMNSVMAELPSLEKCEATIPPIITDDDTLKKFQAMAVLWLIKPRQAAESKEIAWVRTFYILQMTTKHFVSRDGTKSKLKKFVNRYKTN
jgi:hypothetical protein